VALPDSAFFFVGLLPPLPLPRKFASDFLGLPVAVAAAAAAAAAAVADGEAAGAADDASVPPPPPNRLLPDVVRRSRLVMALR
jgi:hypothetical protein